MPRDNPEAARGRDRETPARCWRIYGKKAGPPANVAGLQLPTLRGSGYAAGARQHGKRQPAASVRKSQVRCRIIMLATMTLARAGVRSSHSRSKAKAAHRIGEQPEVGRVTRNVGRIPLENPSRSRCDPSKAYWRSLRSALLVTRAGRIGVMVDVALAIAIFALLQVIACTLLSNAALTPTGPWPALCCRGCLREPCLRLLTQLLVRAGRIGVRQAHRQKACRECSIHGSVNPPPSRPRRWLVGIRCSTIPHIVPTRITFRSLSIITLD